MSEGHRVVNADRTINYFSVSALEKADPRSGGCMRKWYLRYVVGIKEAQSASMAAGTAMHAEIADYLTTGSKHLSALVLSGLHILPEPNDPQAPDLLIEQSIGSPAAPFVYAGGIPLKGFIDCTHDRETNRGDATLETTGIDPPGTVEVIDWKWKRDGAKLEYFMQPAELIKSIQMSGYGVFISKAFPSKSYVRLSHGYFPSTRGKPRKVTRLHVIDDAVRSWEYVDGLARAVIDVAKETDLNRVPGNVHACSKYGGCPYRGDPCQMHTQTSTAMLFGESMATELKEDFNMGLLSNLPPALAPVQTPQATAVDLRLQLAHEEAQQRQVATQTAVGVLPGFAEACAQIDRAGRGFPALSGQAAQMRGAVGGYSVSAGAALAGSGELGALQIQEAAHVIQLGAELAALSAPVAPQPSVYVPPMVTHVQHFTAPVSVAPSTPMVAPSILPPDAPQSNPALAAKPIEGFTPPGVQPSALPVNTPIPSDGGDHVAPKKRGRPPKAKTETVSAPGAFVPPVQDTSRETSDLEVYVDAIPNCEFESLHPYLDHILVQLCTKFSPGGLQDVRCAPKDSPLGFGGWRGAIRAMVMECPPPPARYYLDTRSNEIAAEAADAMRVVCERSSALYVKGIR